MIWFVYRSHYEGPLSKRVRRLDAKSVVEWFAERMVRATNDPALVEDDPAPSTKALWKELGGGVYGLESIFAASKVHHLEPPRDAAELRRLLHEHLYVEGGPENIQVDEQSLRVLTDDDEVALAYYFFDDDLLAKQPERCAYLVHDDPHLPTSIVDTPSTFEFPERLHSYKPRGTGPGRTYTCMHTFYDSDSLPGSSIGVFDGIRLPELATHMLAVVPQAKPQTWSAEWFESWPLELRLLRAMLETGDSTLAAALTRLQTFPLAYVGSSTNHSRVGIGPHAVARGEFAALAGDRRSDGDPSKSIIDEQAHALLFAHHATKSFGYQQWILFDDLWAAKHRELAASLLQYTQCWDPFDSP